MVLRSCGLTVLVVSSAALLLSGCASPSSGLPHLYSPARDKQGQEVSKAWGTVDLNSQLSVPRKNLKALLDEQLAVEDEIWNAFRTAQARQMAQGWTLAQWRGEMKGRLEKLAGTGTAESLKADANALKLANGSLHNINVTRGLAGLPPADCEELSTPAGLVASQQAASKIENGDVRAVALATLGDAAPHCRTIAGIAARGGELGAASALLEKDKAAVEGDKARAAALKDAYAAAKKSYDETALTLLGDPSDPTARVAVDKAIAKLGALVDKIKSAQDAFSAKLLTEERLASLDGFLTTYKDVVAGKAVEDGNRFAIALAVFPDIRDKARKSLRDAQKPNLVPLTLQKNVELAKLQAAQKDIDLREQVVAERTAQLDSLHAQVDALVAALGAFNDASVQAQTGKPVLEVMSATGDSGLEARIKLWRASTKYLDAQGRLRAETSKAYYRISALEHEKVLTRVESGINQWKAIIDPSVDLMAGYGAAGLKSSDLIELFKAATLLWIGAGVN